MKLTIWENMVSQLEVNKSYQILHLSTRLFQNNKTLTSTKQTTVTLIADISNCVAPTIDNDIVTKEGKIKQSCHKSITGTVCVSSGYEKFKLTIFSSVLFTLATANNIDTNDAETVEEYLLSNSFKVSFSKDNKTVLDIKLSVENA